MEIRNPFYGLEIGSCVFGAGKWGKSVVRGQITRTVVQPTTWASMQGQSDYVYTKQMNQGSTSIAGSYGTGLAKLTTAVSGYVGNSSAQSGKSVKVNYQILVRGGLEYVNFEDLTPALLIEGLSGAAKSATKNALNAYLALNKALQAIKEIKEPKLFAVIRDPTRYKDANALLVKWLEAVNDFKNSYGDGMVVQVAWGGIGIVSMEITNQSSENTWKYGGESNFSYAAVDASVAVGATYDGGQSKGEAKVTVNCTQFSSGSPVEAQTKTWFAQVTGKSFQELAAVKVLDKAPDMTTRAAVKNPPEFFSPKKDKALADMIGGIGSSGRPQALC